jgi:hypothetical protein
MTLAEADDAAGLSTDVHPGTIRARGSYCSAMARLIFRHQGEYSPAAEPHAGCDARSRTVRLPVPKAKGRSLREVVCGLS